MLSYNMHFTEEEMVGSVAIFNTKLDMFITGVWPYKFAQRILHLWLSRGRDISHCEIRRRILDSPDTSVILILDKNMDVIAYFHWVNKGYALAYSYKEHAFVKYTPPADMDISEIYKDRFKKHTWNGKGKIIDISKFKSD